MKFSVLLVVAATMYLCEAQEGPIHNRYVREPKEVATRRQAVSYTTNVLHQDPNHPDQTAESTVKVDFNPSKAIKTSTKRQVAHQSQQTFQRYPYQQTNSVQSYVQNPRHVQTPSPQSQLFNVGYSLNFAGGNLQQIPINPLAQKSSRNQNLEEAEIITGTRKQNEEVEIPQLLDPTPQEYVTNALQEQKQKISGIKPKYTQAVRPLTNLKTILQQANLAPITQKYLKALQHIKHMFRPLQKSVQNKWQNLSPGVEIYKSRELPYDQNNVVPGSQIPSLYNQFQIYQKPTKQTATPQLVPTTTGSKQTYSQLPISLPPITDQRGQSSTTTNFKYPIDTRLIREPVLTTNSKNVGTDSKTIPIILDTRLVQDAMKNQLGQYQYQVQYATDSAASQSQHLGKTNQGLVYQNNYGQNYGQNYAVPAQQYQQQQAQLRIAEEPNINQLQYQQYNAQQQPKINFSTLKNQYMKDLYSTVDNVNQRQPRGRSSDYSLQTKLRPPPMMSNNNHNYQRRMLIGI